MRALEGPVDALSVASRLRESDAWCWLDGARAAVDESDGSWSYLGVASEVRHATVGREREFLEGLRADGESAEGPMFDGAPDPGFSAGWVVALGYEFGVGLLGLTAPVDDAPPAFALRIDVVLAVHEATGRAELRGSEAAMEAWLAEHGWILQGRLSTQVLVSPAAAPRPSEPVPPPAPRDRVQSGANWRRSDARYRRDVESCRAAIRAGDAYVLCLTDTATVPGVFDPFEVYSRLRSDGGGVRGGLIVAGSRALLSASPERFLGVRREGARSWRVETHPIKGTRPRGGTPEQDARLAAELAADPKEHAENLMIVDLMRNDLSRVCVPESVQTTGFQRVEHHPQVHQLVSTVQGTLRDGCDIYDALEACFPGGSMTGAPKRRAVEILIDLEAAPRGLYAGCFGWIDDGGAAEIAMSIRGVELRSGTALIGAGGGVTIDSDPERELAECRLKARAALAALEPSGGAIR